MIIRRVLAAVLGVGAAGARGAGDRSVAAAADDGGRDRRAILELPALSTVSLWLKRIGLGSCSRLEPPEPPNRYERRHPGELVHVDIKELGPHLVLGAGHRVPSVIARASTRGGRIDMEELRNLKLTGFEYLHE